MKIFFNNMDEEGNITNHNVLIIENYNFSISKPDFNKEDTKEDKEVIKKSIKNLVLIMALLIKIFTFIIN